LSKIEIEEMIQMDIMNTLILVAGFAGVIVGGQQFLKSLPLIKRLRLKGQSLQDATQKHVLWMVLTAVGVGLLGLAVVYPVGTGFFTAFFYPVLFTLASLWVYTAIDFRLNHSLDAQFEPMLGTNIMLFIFPALIFFYLSLEAIEPGFTYPLPKGIPFANPLITFYAVFILSGALLAYTLAEREFTKLGKKKGYVEDIFIIAFPAGILGARLWYVWGQWDIEFATRDFWHVFAIWEGGLAIMGGALGGALVGILYVLWKRKDIKILQAIDIAVPTILVAQAVGRWGNFFNQEVYGVITDVSQWSWLPTFIQQQMTIGGSFRVPLFLIESFINLTGYFVIRYGIGEGLKRYQRPGDQALMYLVWYGLTRGIMEPLRNPTFNMGNDGNWSFVWGWVFFATGLLAILVNHFVLPKLVKKST
jgi:phosphatidylglycerol:prolipoprotein diacylglycerol transferase